MLFSGGFTFTNFATDLFAIFLFFLWFWLFITVAGDLFRRHDISGFGKILWVILLIVLPYIGIFVYLLTQKVAWHSGMKSWLGVPVMSCARS
jgi:hypothetical protein